MIVNLQTKSLLIADGNMLAFSQNVDLSQQEKCC